ncbi:GntR family transcriptional regulator [Neobacillus sp. C211]|jgi:DNA-binding GntR family transcriptional regulator|uniref:GntR family transcriptional regulator n=1 Tax=Priestia megaterium TaxID=1404 RepID=A0A6H1NYX7_PRIMG|nr:GntR family transcriptional regulator [Priestia megaterium]QIZ06483.1 GntR family transcriptional regulator [Priestia megaterium]
MDVVSLKPIKKERTTQDKVYKQIKKAILFGGFSQDEIFTEVQLAETLNTSRTPVRAALQDLVKEGLLVSIPRKGVTVRKITQEEQDEIFLLRSSIEVQVVKKLTEVITSPDQLKILRLIVEQQKEALENEDAIRFIELDHEFHLSLTRLANYSIMEEVLQNLHNLTQLMGLKAIRKQGRMKNVIKEHSEIIQSLETRNSELVSAVILNHLDNTKDTLNDLANS